MKVSLVILGVAILGVAGCGTPAPTVPYPPGLQSFMVDGSIATLVARTCPDLARDEQALDARLIALRDAGLANGYTAGDLDYFLANTDTDQVGNLVFQRFEQAGLILPAEDDPEWTAKAEAFDRGLCAYGARQRAAATDVGKLLL